MLIFPLYIYNSDTGYQQNFTVYQLTFHCMQEILNSRFVQPQRLGIVLVTVFLCRLGDQIYGFLEGYNLALKISTSIINA